MERERERVKESLIRKKALHQVCLPMLKEWLLMLLLSEAYVRLRFLGVGK
jgi:hypothetical protein